MEFIQTIWPHISAHPYVYLFLGMLVGGEAFLLPAVYLTIHGSLQVSAVFLFSALATLISDSAWYAVGRSFPLANILSWKRFSARRESYTKIYDGFRVHSQKLLFVSKFVYGTRTIVQILSGSIRMPFWRYSVVNLSGIMSYLASIFLLALFAEKSLASFRDISYNKYEFAAVFIILILIFHLCLKKWLNKNFLA